MDTSFYTAAQGARMRQKQMNVIANNISNINTNGYRAKEVAFGDLMYYNMHPGNAEDWDAGAGCLIERTMDSQEQGSLVSTGDQNNFAIEGSGYFMLLDSATGEITYTRDGSFSASQRADGFYLVNNAGKLVLDKMGQPIQIGEQGVSKDQIGVFDFPISTGLLSKGDNEWQASAQNGQPYLITDAKVRQGCIEESNVDLAKEMAKVIESSRSYSYNLKMVQTSDEIEQAINNLR